MNDATKAKIKELAECFCANPNLNDIEDALIELSESYEDACILLRRVLAWRAGDGDGITDPVRKEIIEYLRGAE